MPMFSKTCVYAIKIMIHLTARKGDGRAGLEEISKAIDSPKPFTAKILQSLKKAGLLRSVRGPGGGFQIRNKNEVTLQDIVEIIDGKDLITDCVLGFSKCTSKHPCPVHHRFEPVRDLLSGTLNSTSLYDLQKTMEEGNGFLKEKK